MKIKTLLFIGSLFLVCFCAAQELISAEDIAKHTYSFTLKDGKLSGQGFDKLQEAIDGSQFFLLGEYHGEAGISYLTEALLPKLADEGYKHFAVEIGPTSAAKLTELVKSKNPQESIRTFYNEQIALTGDIPIPFFDGIEDVEFLQVAMKEKFDLWGLDQEFIYGYLFLVEELWKQNEFPERYRNQYEIAREKIKEFYAVYAENEEIEVHDQILNDETVLDFLKSMNKNECRCCPDIAQEIIESCEIYHNWTNDLLENLEARTDMMKRHFLDYYNQANERMPKVFVKMGGMHTGRGFTGNADFEIGNMLYELATINGSHSVHVGFATRYYLDMETGEVGDNLTYESEWVENMTPILAQGDMVEWQLIDLRPIKKLWINRERKLNTQIKKLIRSHDYIIIMPPLPETTPNHTALNE